MVIDAIQFAAAKYVYDPFGSTISAMGPMLAENAYGFSSKDLHVASGLVYYGYRFYAPLLQRWLNRDPIQELGGKNLFEFVENRPLNGIDREGLQYVPPLIQGPDPFSKNTVGNGYPGTTLNGGNAPVAYPRNNMAQCSAAQVGATRNRRSAGTQKISCPCSGEISVNCQSYQQCEVVLLPNLNAPWTTTWSWVDKKDCDPCPEYSMK
jgi:RHS repeat-associated protein